VKFRPAQRPNTTGCVDRSAFNKIRSACPWRDEACQSVCRFTQAWFNNRQPQATSTRSGHLSVWWGWSTHRSKQLTMDCVDVNDQVNATRFSLRCYLVSVDSVQPSEVTTTVTMRTGPLVGCASDAGTRAAHYPSLFCLLIPSQHAHQRE